MITHSRLIIAHAASCYICFFGPTDVAIEDVKMRNLVGRSWNRSYSAPNIRPIARREQLVAINPNLDIMIYREVRRIAGPPAAENRKGAQAYDIFST